MNNKINLISALIILFLAAVDSTIVGTVLPVIKGSFSENGNIGWIISGYFLGTLIATPYTGNLIDKYGEKSILLFATALFGICSFFIAKSFSLDELIVLRVVQGIAAGMMIVLVYVIIGKMFDNDNRGKMQGLLSAIWGVAAVAGPFLGVILVESFGWQSVFLINLPLTLVGFVGILFFYTVDKRDPARKLDIKGVTMFTLFVVSTFGVFFEGLVYIEKVLLLIFSIIIFYLLYKHILKHRERSFLGYEFLSNKDYRLIAGVIILASVVLYSSIVLLPLFLYDVLQQSVTDIGFVILFSSLGWVISASTFGKKVDTFGYKRIINYGLILLSSSLMLIIIYGSLQVNFLGLLYLINFILGAGMGLIATATLLYVQNNAQVTRMGTLTASVQLFRNVGAALGITAVLSVQIALTAVVSVFSSYMISFGVILFSIVTFSLFWIKFDEK